MFLSEAIFSGLPIIFRVLSCGTPKEKFDRKLNLSVGLEFDF